MVKAGNCNGFVPETKRKSAEHEVQLFDKTFLRHSTHFLAFPKKLQDKTILTRKCDQRTHTQLSATSERLVRTHSPEERYQGSPIQVLRLTLTLLVHLYSFSK